MLDNCYYALLLIGLNPSITVYIWSASLYVTKNPSIILEDQNHGNDKPGWDITVNQTEAPS